MAPFDNFFDAPAADEPEPEPVAASPQAKPVPTANERGAADGLTQGVAMLADLLEAENEALVRFDLQTVAGMVDRKVELTRFYEGRMRAIASRPSILSALDEDELAELKELAERMDVAADHNRHLLRIRIDSAQHVIDAVGSSVREEITRSSTSYDRKGRLDANGRRLNIAINGNF
jgi:hypothetical protein